MARCMRARPNIRSGSIASVWPRTADFRYTSTDIVRRPGRSVSRQEETSHLV